MEFLTGYFPVILAAGSSMVLYAYKNWRWNILAISLQYVAVFWLVLSVWPTGLAAVKLVSGWMAVAVLGSSIPNIDSGISLNQMKKQEIGFRIIFGLIILLIISIIGPGMRSLLPVSIPLILGGSLITGFGLLTVGMTSHPLRIIFGLLSIFSGFEVIYAALEQSVMVAGFLSLITLGIALVGAYLLNHNQEIENS